MHLPVSVFAGAQTEAAVSGTQQVLRWFLTMVLQFRKERCVAAVATCSDDARRWGIFVEQEDPRNVYVAIFMCALR